MPELPNYYEILGVRPTDDASAIKRAYYARMRRYHPDNFIAEYKRLEIVGDKQGLKRLDETIAHAQKQTQIINAAYTVLSDTERRTHYDYLRTSRQKVTVPPEYSGSPDAYYDAHRHRRPHGRPPAPGKHATPPQPDRFPAVLAVGFLVVLTLSTAFLSNFLVPPQRVRQALPPTLNIPAGSMDATAVIMRHTPTPRPAQSYIASGDALYRAGLFDNAIDEYTHALERHLRTAEVYLKRGRAYAANGAFDLAMADFNRAETLDAELPDVYRERSLVYLALWRQSGSEVDAESARRDLDAYAQHGGDMTLPEILEAQSFLFND